MSRTRGNQWGTCPMCLKERKVTPDGFMASHKAYVPLAQAMYACNGSWQLPVALTGAKLVAGSSAHSAIPVAY